MMKYSKNMTIDVIKIDEFEKKQIFSYCVLHFKNILDVHEQGKILECYFQNRNFLLIPRNQYENIAKDNEGNTHRNNYSSALLLLWTEIGNNEELEKIKDTMTKMLSNESNILIQGKLILGNGSISFTFDKAPLLNDNDAAYSYLITHRFINNKYIYRISSNESFKNHFIDNVTNLNGIVLDIVFTGRATNIYNNCYNFSNYKIKDYLIKDNKVILSNVKGVIDLEKCFVPANYITMLNLLQTWRNPIELYSDYYSNMSIRIATLVPEDKVRIEDSNAYFNNKIIDTSNRRVIVLRDEEKRYELLNNYIKSWNISAMVSEFISSKETLEMLIERFNKGRIEQEKENIRREREEAINYVRISQKQIEEIEERILLLEHRTKDFIPFPDIILPKNPDRKSFRVDDILRFENNKYIIREENRDER